MPRTALTITLITCTSKHVRELGPLLLSLAASSPGAHVVVFADTPGQAALLPCVSTFRGAARPPFDLLL